MRKRTKGWMTAGVILLAVGAALFVGVMCFLKWDFKKLGTDRYETVTYGVTEVFTDVSVLTNESDVVLLPSDTGECRVVCYENVQVKHAVEVTDGTLTVRVEDGRKWYHYIGFSTDRPRITVYLPQGDYGALTVKGRTGDVSIPKELGFASVDASTGTGSLSCLASVTGDVTVKASTGNVRVEGASAANLTVTVSTGNVRLEACDAAQIAVKTSTGNVRLEACDAARIVIETSTGDVTGTLISDKIFTVSTNTGKVEVPGSVTGGACEITTDTGDVRIEIVTPAP